MLTIYENRSGALERQKGKPRITEAAVWIDLLNPTPEEEEKIERALKFDVPTREEQQEIEASSRLYQEDGAYFMTATLLYQPEQGEPQNDAGHLHSCRPAARHRALCASRGPSPSMWRDATGPRRTSRAGPPS